MSRILLFCLFFLYSVFLFSQDSESANSTYEIEGTAAFISGKLSSSQLSPLNGNGTLGQSLNLTKCGLNYTSATQKLGKRGTVGGVNQPAPYTISGIPNCAVIEKAFLYVETAGNGIAITATVQNPSGTSQNYPMTLIGSGPDKCWSYSGSHAYRADVTSIVTGNGNYLVSGIPTDPPNAGNDADGATLLVIYSDPAANYQGQMIIHDGIVVVNGGTTTQNVNGFNACSNSTLAKGFMIVADFQMAPVGLSVNGTAATITWNWFNFIEANTTVTAGQTTSPFTVNSGGDCYALITAGLYFQTTTCTTCPSSAPGLLTATSTKTNVSCFGGNNGSATITPSGGTGNYTYSWSPSGGTGPTATGLSAGTYTSTVTDENCGNVVTQIIITEPAAITTTGSQTNVSCNNGSNGTATVSVSGGTGTYTYSWSPSGGTGSTASGLSAGAYTVTITDGNGCTASRSYTITEPVVLSITPSQVNVACFGDNTGSASVVLSGGTAPYTYSWSPVGGTGAAASGLSAGSYLFTATDNNGCTATETFVITEPVDIVISPSHTNVSCNGLSDGTATATVTGGTGTYTYSWSPAGGSAATASGLAAGTYQVTVTDASGCSEIQSYTITEPVTLTATNSHTDVTCFGGNDGTATVTPAGGTSPYTYSWSPSGGASAIASGLTAGNYTATISDAKGCSVTSIVTVSSAADFIVTPAQTNVSCFGNADGIASVNVSGGTPGYTYSWSHSGSTSPTVTGLIAGNYNVTITDASGCMETTSFVITQPTALSVTSSQINVSCNSGSDGSATVTPAGGTASYTYSWSPVGGSAATASGLSAGSYMVTVTDAQGCTITESYIITEPTVLSVSESHTDVTCFGGSDGTATATPTGGTGAYTYSWSPSGITTSTASGLSSGTHVCTVTDANGCSTNISVLISEPTALVLTQSQTDVLCNGNTTGEAIVNVSGGTGTYTYSWTPNVSTSNIASNLIAGAYSVLVTDANGCTITANFTINEPSALAVSETHTDLLCYNDSTGTASITVSGGTAGYTYSWSPNVSTGSTAGNLDAGVYSVEITDANGCFISTSVTITEPVILSTTQSQINVSCNDGSDGSATVTVAGGTIPYTYNWTPAVSSIATASNLNAGNYTVNVVDANGCQITNNFTITEPDTIVVIQSQQNVLCKDGSSGSASVDVSGGTGSYAFSWTPNVSTSDSASNLSAGSYTVVITDANGCTYTSNFNITEPDSLTAVQSQTDILCAGYSTGEASVTVSGGVSPYTYSWTSDVSTSSTATGLTAGNYNVLITDANGCSITVNFTITEPAGMISSLSHTDALCYGDSSGSATISISGGILPYTYSWSPNVSTTGSAINLYADNYIVTVTDGGGCMLTDTIIVSQPDSLSLSETHTDVLCNGGSTGTATVSVSGGTAPYTYSWTSLPDITSSVSGLPIGIYSVLVTDNNGCSSTMSISISEPDSLSLIISSQGTTCSLPNGSATASVSGGTLPYTYSWNSSAQIDSSIVNVTAGTYFVQVTDANGCTSSESVLLSDQPGPVSSISSFTDATCNGDSDGTATVTYTSGTPPFTIAWNTSPVQNNSIATGLSAGSYYVVITDSNSCKDTSTVTISEPLPVIVNLSSSSLQICYGDVATLTANATGGNGNDYNFTWNNGLADTSSHTISPTSQTLYTVYATDTAGCISSVDSVIINVYEQLIGTISITDNEICIGDEVTVSVSVSGGAGNYGYSWTGYSETDAVLEDVPLESGFYNSIVSDQCGTLDLNTAVTVNPLPVVNAESDTTIVIGNSANLSASPGLSYEWQPGITLDDPSSSNPVATPEESTVYYITATDQNGCKATDSVSVEVIIKNDVFVPSAFSPNGDGENDILYVRGTAITSLIFTVYDRWGHPVFQSTDKSKGWDGTLKGSMMNTAVFVYYVEVSFMDGETRILKGDVTLIR